MLTARVDKKKIFQYSAVLGVIFLIIIYVVLTNFVFKADEEIVSGDNVEKNIIKGIIKEVNELNVQVIETEKFKELKENVYKEEKIEDLNIGKKNPFSSKSLKDVASSTVASTTINKTEE